MSKTFIPVGTTRGFEIAVENDPNGTVIGTATWSSSNNAVATVAVDPNTDRRGDVTGVAGGTATITVHIGLATNTFDVVVQAVPSPTIHITSQPQNY